MKMDPSAIEIAKALKQVKAVADRAAYQQILGILAASQAERVGQAVAGLTQEDEFLLLCMLMGTATHLAPLEQRSAIVAGKSAPDLLARFQPHYWGSRGYVASSKHSGYRCFVEVKSTKESEFAMGGAALQRLRGFAEAFELPLVFAVRFLRFSGVALWVIAEDADPATTSMRLNISHWINGLRPVLWSEHSYMLIPGTQFEATYSSTAATGAAVLHSDYGEQTAFEIVTHKGRFSYTGADALLASMFFESYGLEEAESQRANDVTRVTYRARNLSMSIADLIYGVNRLPRDEDGELVYDPSRTLRELADGQTPMLIGRQTVEELGNRFCDIGAVALGEYGDPEARYQLWLATGGQPTS